MLSLIGSFCRLRRRIRYGIRHLTSFNNLATSVHHYLNDMILGGIQFIVGNNKAIKNAAKRSVSRQKKTTP